MGPREVVPAGGPCSGAHKVYASARGGRGWRDLCRSRPNSMRRCYIELADNPFPPFPTPRHHQMKGKLAGVWEYEAGGGERVRYKRAEGGEPVVIYAGSAPPH